VKSICLDFGIKPEFGGRCNLHFDSKRETLRSRGGKTLAVAQKLWERARREYARLSGEETANHARLVMNALANLSQV
jgi:hypothetical protein